MKSLSIIIPVFDEEDSLPELIKRLLSLKKIFDRDNVLIDFIFVDDGSKDTSLEILKKICSENNFFKAISLTRNFGHQVAISAGIDIVNSDYVAIIDADLQDPPELIYDMYKVFTNEIDVVYGQRLERKGDSFFKRFSAKVFYRLLNYLSGTKIPSNTGDFRIINRKVVDVLKNMKEKNRFVRGMIPWTGFNEVAFGYVREKRFSGKTKYPLRQMTRFAVSAILSFSSKPLTLTIRIGVLITSFGFLGGILLLYLELFTSYPVPFLSSILLPIIFFSGLQISLIGLIGIYIASIFDEVKERPLYLINEKINL